MSDTAIGFPPEFASLPKFLRALSRWLLWRNIVRNGKATKLPLSARNTEASSTDPSTWCDFNSAARAFASVPGLFDGLGIVLGQLPDGTYLIGIDLDACLRNGWMAAWAMQFLNAIDTYAEYSPSGTGVKIFFRVRAEDIDRFKAALSISSANWGRKATFGEATNGGKAPAAEIYFAQRFFTTTNRQYPCTPDEIALATPEQLGAIAALFPPRAERTEPGCDLLPDDVDLDVDETTLRIKLERAMAGPHFAARWNGATAGMDDASGSAFDMALGAMMKARGFTFAEMREACMRCPHGTGRKHSDDPRHWRRIWERASTEAPPEPPEHLTAVPPHPGPEVQAKPSRRPRQSGTGPDLAELQRKISAATLAGPAFMAAWYGTDEQAARAALEAHGFSDADAAMAMRVWPRWSSLPPKDPTPPTEPAPAGARADRPKPSQKQEPGREPETNKPDGEAEQEQSAPNRVATPPGDTSFDVLTEIDMLGPDLTLRKLVEIFNRKYAVANEGGKAVVLWAVRDPLLQRDRHDRASFPDFIRFYQNHTFAVLVKDADGKEKPVTKSYAVWWLNHERRRQFLGGVVFDPANRTPATSLNLWRGWTVAPKPGDWSLMQSHIKRIICGGRTEIFDYVLSWLAHMVQKPHLAAEVAIVLRGLKGVGKGMLGKWLLRLCGQHGLHIVNASHLTGRFSGHLRDAIFVFADEAFFAGDRQHEGVLKGIITETEILIEAKYRTPIMAPNMLHLLMASNATWVIPASHDERRYLMLDVAADKKGDAAYFRQLDRQMEQGGLAAMLHDLLTMDLGEFHPRAVPITTELAEQKIHSLDTLHRWWMTVLDRGFVWRSRYGHKDFLCWSEFVSTELLNHSYRQWCADNRVLYPEHREALGGFLAKFYPHHRPRGSFPIYEAESVDREAPEPVVKQEHPRGFRVGDIEAARSVLADKLALPDDALPWNRGGQP